MPLQRGEGNGEVMNAENIFSARILFNSQNIEKSRNKSSFYDAFIQNDLL